MTLNQYFSHIYCINLDRRTDRWESMQEKLAILSIDSERFSATDLLALSNKKGTPKQRGRYACTDSHYRVIKDAQEKGYESILILEDDCEFVEGFNTKIAEYLAELPPKWEMLMLGYYMGPEFPKSQIKDKKVFKIPKNKDKSTGLWASHAVAIKRELFRDILTCPNGAFSEQPHSREEGGYGCIDITYYYQFHGYRECYAFNPPLVNQAKIDTDVDLVTEETRIY